MIFLTMLFIVCILGALMGVRKPWMGGIAGLLATPFLFFSGISQNVTILILNILIFFLLSAAYGFMSFIIISGLKGGRHNVGQTYISGFGAHHPGGIILTDEELKTLKNKNRMHIRILSY